MLYVMPTNQVQGLVMCNIAVFEFMGQTISECGGYGATYLVYGDPVDISVVHKPNDLIGEELSIVL